MKGVPRHCVVLEEHSDEWKNEYEITRALLLEIIDANVLDIQHVGSTATSSRAAPRRGSPTRS